MKTIEDPHDIISEMQSPAKFSMKLQDGTPERTPKNKLWKRGPNSTFNSQFQQNASGGMNKVMDEARMYDYFFDLVSRGGKKEISKLKECLENDPKSNFYGKGDPKHMINRKNFLG